GRCWCGAGCFWAGSGTVLPARTCTADHALNTGMEVGLVRLVRCRRTLVLALLLALSGGLLLGGAVPAMAQPAPPPNPSDDELRRSREAVTARAGEVAQLTAQLAELDARTDELQAALAAERENAEAALLELEAAREAAAAAKTRAEQARIETQAATVAIDQARERLDEIVSSTYLQGLDAGPLGLLTEATSPEDLLARAEFTDMVARAQLQAQEGLERARVEKANADSAARAALEAAEQAEADAAAAKEVADRALAAAQEA